MVFPDTKNYLVSAWQMTRSSPWSHTSLDCRSWGLCGPVCLVVASRRCSWDLSTASNLCSRGTQVSTMSLAIACKDARLSLLATSPLNWWKCSSLAGVWCLTWQAELWGLPALKCEWGQGWGWRNRNRGAKEWSAVGWAASSSAPWWLDSTQGSWVAGVLFVGTAHFEKWAHIQMIIILLYCYIITS